jgi:hypothetical protein
MKMKSNMSKDFGKIPTANIQRSAFNRTSSLKTTFDGGQLIPIFVDEALPGDTFVMNPTIFARLATPLTPVMDNMFLDMFWFAVPNRLLWTNWERFCGAQDDPADSIDYTLPQLVAPAGGWLTGSMSDYFGLPIKQVGLSVASLHHRAYNLIWNEWFRDENIQDSVVVDVDDGPDTDTDYVILSRGKRPDYFTTCLPWPQKGDAISLALTGDAPVTGIGKNGSSYGETNVSARETDGTGAETYATAATFDSNAWYGEQDPANTGWPNIRANLAGVNAVSINDLREAFALQRMAERDARGGTRYTEIIKSHFNVNSKDSRLQRPEYLGGNSTEVVINQVPQTSESNTTAQGTMTGYGTAHNSGGGFSKSFTEHCVIIGMVSVRADLTYQQGIDRMFSRSTKVDYYWPELAHLGEQSVLNKEIFADNSANDDLVFGYQERYAEYRYKQSKITGLFKSDATASLEAWHLSQDFATLPTLSDTFIKDTPPIDRVIAVQSEPHFIFDSLLKLKCIRPMPVYGIPSLVNRL